MSVFPWTSWISLHMRRLNRIGFPVPPNVKCKYTANKICIHAEVDALFEAKEMHDGQVLSSLRHDPIVGGHHEENEVDSGRTRHHILDQTLVAGDIDDADPLPPLEYEWCKAEIDGEPAGLLLWQSVWIQTRQAFDQLGFSMVNVPGSADDYIDDGLEVFFHAGATMMT